jgi:hypothetical protein
MRYAVVPLAGVVIFLCADLGSAQPPLEAKDGKVTVPLLLHPAKVQQPVSRNYLLPEYKDSIPGNSVQMFLRCILHQVQYIGPEESAKREKWNALPTADLPVEEVKDYGGQVLGREAVDAARMLSVDWQLWSFIQRDGVNTLLPDVQKIRELASMLKTRARGQIRAGNPAGAIQTLRTLFALARTLESHPTLIGQLVGVAIAMMGAEVAEELVQMPRCPNLYWSFTDLPSPFLDLRMALQGERLILAGALRSVLETPVTQAELDRVIKIIGDIVLPLEYRLNKELDQAIIEKRFLAWAAEPERVKTCRTWLEETGIAPDVVKAMSPLQVVVANDVQKQAVYQDEMFKWMKLPFWETGPIQEVDEAIRKEQANLVLARVTFLMTLKVKQAQARLDQRFAYLRVIEAIRLHAHQNNGKLPASLEEIKLPLPLDPVTGKAFGYTLKEGVITLAGGNASPNNPMVNRVYEIRLSK